MRRPKTRAVEIATLLLLASTQLASAQMTPTVGVFRDAAGTQCNLLDSPGVVDVYVVATSAVTLRTIEFAAPKPACFDATYLADESNYLALGNSQTGISITFGVCLGSPVHVLTIRYLSDGNTPDCCVYPILPHPGSASGLVEFVDCDYDLITGVALDHTVNGNETCFCGIDPPPSVPSYAFPGDGATGLPVVTTLSWSSEDPFGDPVVFDIYMGTDADPPLVAAGWADTSYSPDILEYDQEYHWKVVAHDDKGMQSTSPVWTFHTRAWSWKQLIVNSVDDHCELANNDTVVVEVDIVDSGIPIDDGGFDLTYDPSLLTPIGCERGNLTASWAQLDWQDLGTHVRVSGADAIAIPPESSGSFARIFFLATCCAADSTAAVALCADSVAGDLRSLWRECSQYVCGVYTADGDANGDGLASPADALCALESYLSFPVAPPSSCASLGWDVRIDVDCSGDVTPADALCVFRSWLDESCSFCGAGAAPPGSPRTEAVVTVLDAGEAGDGNEFAVVLGLGGVASLEAFGFDVRFPEGQLAFDAARRGTLTRDFTAFESQARRAQGARVGGYATRGVRASGEPLVELRFRKVVDAPGGEITLTRFVDDLGAVADVVIPLSGDGSQRPPRTQYVLHQNQPNPFNPTTAIGYEIPDGAVDVPVRLAVYTIEGRLVTVLEDTRRDAGIYQALWDGVDRRGEAVASGVYFYVLDAGPARLTRKMVVVK